MEQFKIGVGVLVGVNPPGVGVLVGVLVGEATVGGVGVLVGVLVGVRVGEAPPGGVGVLVGVNVLVTCGVGLLVAAKQRLPMH